MVLAIFLSLLMGALDNFVVLTALSKIVTDLGQPNGIPFVVSAYLITASISIPIFGKLSDILSRRNVLLSGLVIFIAGSALAGLSQNLNELILFRGLQGFGAGGFFPVSVAITAVLFSPENRARITGLLSGVFGIGVIAGPLLGSFIVDHTTWRWVFYVNIPVGVLGLALLTVSLGPLSPERRGRFDVVGAALLSSWVGALMFALVQVSQAGWGWDDPRVIGLLVATMVLFALFVVWESRTEAPVVPVRYFARRVVAASGGTAFLSRLVAFPLLTFVSIYVGIVLLRGGASAADTVRNVLYFAIVPFVVGSVISGQLMTRLAYRTVLVTGLILAAVGCFFLTFLSASTPVWSFSYGFIPTGGLVVPLMPTGLGLGLTVTPPILAVQFQLDQRDVGAATGLIQFLLVLGGAMGVSLLSTFQQWRFQSLQPTPPSPGCVAGGPVTPNCAAYFQALQNAVVTSYDNVFAATFAVLLIALLFSVFLTGRLPKKQATGTTPAR